MTSGNVFIDLSTAALLPGEILGAQYAVNKCNYLPACYCVGWSEPAVIVPFNDIEAVHAQDGFLCPRWQLIFERILCVIFLGNTPCEIIECTTCNPRTEEQGNNDTHKHNPA